MAPLGTVIKNGLIFILLSAAITYLAAYLLVFGLWQLLTLDDYASNPQQYSAGQNYVWLGLLILVGGTGLIYLKSVSDTVEEGMIEF
ncbi:MAG: hypothetical protein INQ03_16620 [Candidatus Heimdallarchaeota archaeon]|nr:hypothetical protein [Candidatus Heimdallarchaeota archaeon]